MNYVILEKQVHLFYLYICEPSWIEVEQSFEELWISDVTKKMFSFSFIEKENIDI